MNDNLRNSVPVATSETTAFEGLLDVYRFPDGRIAVSSRGAVRGLTGGVAGSRDIERYVVGMLKESSVAKLPIFSFVTPRGTRARGLIGGDTTIGKIERYAVGMIAESGGTKLPIFRFITPRGTRAKGLLLDDYVKIVEWYANRFLGKTLHASQLHIGMQCMAMQAAAARLGWEALVFVLFVFLALFVLGVYVVLVQALDAGHRAANRLAERVEHDPHFAESAEHDPQGRAPENALELIGIGLDRFDRLLRDLDRIRDGLHFGQNALERDLDQSFAVVGLRGFFGHGFSSGA